MTHFSAVMQRSFTSIAASYGIKVNELLLRTWFQIVGASADYLTSIGLTAMLPSAPSKALIDLLTRYSISELNETHPIISNMLNATGSGYNQAILMYLTTAIEIDKPDRLNPIKKSLPIGNTTVHALLNISEAQLSTRNYLTDIYGILKLKSDMILSKSLQPFVNTFLKNVPIVALEKLVGKAKYSNLLSLRKRYYIAQVEMKGKVAVSLGLEMASKIKEFGMIFATKRAAIIANLNSSFVSIAERRNLSLPRLLSMTWFQIFQSSLSEFNTLGITQIIPALQSPKFSTILTNNSISSIMATYPVISNSALLSGKDYKFTTGQFMYVMAVADSALGTLLFVRSIPPAIGTVSIASMFDSTDIDFVKRKYLTDIYPLLRSSSQLITNKSVASYYYSWFKMTVDQAKSLLKGNFAAYEQMRARVVMAIIDGDLKSSQTIGKELFRILTWGLQQRVKELGNKSADSDEVAIKGLIAVGTYVPINIISQVYKINIDLLDSLTMYGLANHISNVSQERFVQIFNISSESIQLLDKARMRDIRVLVALENLLPSMEIDDISPVSLSNVVLKTNNGRLLDTMTVISNARKTSVENMTLSDVKDYGQGTDADVMKLFTVVKVEPSYFNAISQIRLAVVRQIWNTSVHGIGGFNMIDLARALCRKGHRYNGKKCVPFDGCKASGLCSKNASCTNIIGSYLCQCKTGFSKNSIGSCEALPLPSQAQLLGERC